MMRSLIAVVLLGGCLGGGGSGAGFTRPGVLPMLSELPGDPGKRDAVLDSANTTAGPEHRKGQTARERKVETTAATAAAILGSMFSTTRNVTLGGAGTFEENHLVAPVPHAPKPAQPSEPIEPEVTGAALVPWVQLK